MKPGILWVTHWVEVSLSSDQPPSPPPPAPILQSRFLPGWRFGQMLFRRLGGKPGFALAPEQRRWQQLEGWTPLSTN